MDVQHDERVNRPEDDKADESLYLNTACWALIGVSGFFLILRVYCKVHARKRVWYDRLWWDDGLITIAWLSLLTSQIFLSVGVSHGFGRHLYTIPQEHLAMMGYIWEWTGTFGILAATLSKTSFAVTLLRVMENSTSLRVLLWLVIITMNVFMGLNALFGWIRCLPVEKGWRPETPGHCWTPGIYGQYSMFAGGYSAAMDFILASLPWKLVWTLKMGTREKVGVALALSLGIFAGATAVVKTAMIPTLGGDDFTYDGVKLAVWTAAEPAVTVMATTIPVLRSLFVEIKEKTKRTITTDQWTSRKTRTGQSTVTVTADRTRFENESNESSHYHLGRKDGVIDQNMLAVQEEGKILQTREVAIEYEDRVDTESVEFVELVPYNSNELQFETAHIPDTPS